MVNSIGNDPPFYQSLSRIEPSWRCAPAVYRTDVSWKLVNCWGFWLWFGLNGVAFVLLTPTFCLNSSSNKRWVGGSPYLKWWPLKAKIFSNSWTFPSLTPSLGRKWTFLGYLLTLALAKSIVVLHFSTISVPNPKHAFSPNCLQTCFRGGTIHYIGVSYSFWTKTRCSPSATSSHSSQGCLEVTNYSCSHKNRRLLQRSRTTNTTGDKNSSSSNTDNLHQDYQTSLFVPSTVPDSCSFHRPRFYGSFCSRAYAVQVWSGFQW